MRVEFMFNGKPYNFHNSYLDVKVYSTLLPSQTNRVQFRLDVQHLSVLNIAVILHFLTRNTGMQRLQWSGAESDKLSLHQITYLIDCAQILAVDSDTEPFIFAPLKLRVNHIETELHEEARSHLVASFV